MSGINGREYAAKLTDPRWQRIRLKAFERDNFACRCCSRGDLELHAHHSWYEAGLEPWDYPLDSIVTYCHNCHEAEHGRSFAGDAGVLHLLRKSGFPLLEDRLAMVSALLGEGRPLDPGQAREIAFIVGVLCWLRGDTWKEVLRICEARERAQPRYGATLIGVTPEKALEPG